MFGLDEKYPSAGWTTNVQQATDKEPGLLQSTVNRSYMLELDRYVLESTGSTLKELAENNPRDAYTHVYYLFRRRFIDPQNGDWAIGSPEEDGEHAYNGLARYLEERRPPDPDIEEIDVVISVWKRASLLERLAGIRYDTEEAVRFRVGPQNLAAA